MEYVITTVDKRIYLRLSQNGTPISCKKSVAQRFTEEKAKHILDSLPKILQKFNYVMVPAPDDVPVSDDQHLVNETYELPEQVIHWTDRVDNYNSLIRDARARKEQLYDSLSDIDKELSNILHVIEMTKAKNVVDGYREYKKLKQILEKRRVIKDELAIVQSITSYSAEPIKVDHVIKNLMVRDFTFNEIENPTIE